MKKMQRIFFFLKQMSLAALLMMKKFFQILTKNNLFLMNIPVMVMDIIFLCFLWNLLAQFLYMMIMSLILGNYTEVFKGNYICT
jgi:hypothetical protein